MKQEIIDNHWIEFLHFYRDLMDLAKQEEVRIGGEQPSMSDLLGMMTDSSKLQHYTVFQEFSEPSETIFWKWYAMHKMKPNN